MNPLAIISALKWARDHWKALGVAAGLAGAFGSGYRLYPRLHPPVVCAPAVALKVDDHATEASRSKQDTTTKQGPETITTTVEEWAAGAAGLSGETPAPVGRQSEAKPALVTRPSALAPVLTRRTVTVDQRGPVFVSTHETVQAQATDDHHLDLTIKPAAVVQDRHWLELQIGLDDVMHPALENGRVAARIRVPETDWWAEASSLPFHHCDNGRWCPTLGAGIAKSF